MIRFELLLCVNKFGFQIPIYAKSPCKSKESKSSLLSHKYKRSFDRLISKPSQQAEICNKPNCNFLMNLSKERSFYPWLMDIRQPCKTCKELSNSSNTPKFIRNGTENSVDREEIPLRNDMRRGRVRVCRNVIIRMSQKFRIKSNQISSKQTQSQSCYQIFSIKVGVEIYLVALCINSQRIGRSILVQSSKVNQTQSSQQEGKQIVKTIETVQCRVIYAKATPEPTYNTSSNNRQSTCQTSNNGPSPKTHLTPGEDISNKSSQDHDQQDHNSYLPYKFTRLCITCIIQTTEKMHIYHNKKQTCTICMQITQLPSIRNITHQMLNTMKCLIYMCCVMHRQKNTSYNLQNQTQSSLNTPIIITILIRRCRITHQMILHDSLDGLIPQTSALFFHRSFH